MFFHSYLWVTLPKRQYLAILLENLTKWEAWCVITAVPCYAALGKLVRPKWEIALHSGWHTTVTDLKQRGLSYLATYLSRMLQSVETEMLRVTNTANFSGAMLRSLRVPRALTTHSGHVISSRQRNMGKTAQGPGSQLPSV